MKKMMDDFHETITYMFAIFMGGLVIATLLLPCFLP